MLFLTNSSNSYPGKKGLLLTAVQLNLAYGSIIMNKVEKVRAVLFFKKARDYGFNILAKKRDEFRDVEQVSFEQYSAVLEKFSKKDVPEMYYTAQSWVMWIIAEGSWAALYDIPKAEKLLERIIELDGDYYYGMPYALLASIYSSRPAEQGGRPEEAGYLYEKALAAGRGRSLMLYVLYAGQYCRRIYDRKLHDRLLNYVTAADPEDLPKELFVVNKIAIEEARELLKTAEEYF